MRSCVVSLKRLQKIHLLQSFFSKKLLTNLTKNYKNFGLRGKWNESKELPNENRGGRIKVKILNNA